MTHSPLSRPSQHRHSSAGAEDRAIRLELRGGLRESHISPSLVIPSNGLLQNRVWSGAGFRLMDLASRRIRIATIRVDRNAMNDASGNSATVQAGEKHSPVAHSAFLQPAIWLAILAVGCAFAYALLLSRFDLWKPPSETQFGARPKAAEVWLYLQPLHVDPVNDSIRMRISVVPDPSLADPATIADRNYLLKISRGKQTEHLEIRANQSLPEITLDIDLDAGDIRDYPLDHYLATIGFSASQKAPDGKERMLPIHITAWEGILGFSVTGQQTATQRPGEFRLQFSVRRTGAAAFFGIAIYVAMMVMAICALVVGTLLFLGIRCIDVALLGAFAATIFALPALRHALPGSPPLGVRADILIFFWAELVAIIALCLFVLAWVRRGPRPAG